MHGSGIHDVVRDSRLGLGRCGQGLRGSRRHRPLHVERERIAIARSDLDRHRRARTFAGRVAVTRKLADQASVARGREQEMPLERAGAVLARDLEIGTCLSRRIGFTVAVTFSAPHTRVSAVCESSPRRAKTTPVTISITVSIPRAPFAITVPCCGATR